MRNAINYPKLEKLRKRHGLTAKDVAGILNRENGLTLSGQTVRNWESGTRPWKKYRPIIRNYIKRLEKFHYIAPTPVEGSGWTPEARKKLSESMKRVHKEKTEAGIPWMAKTERTSKKRKYVKSGKYVKDKPIPHKHMGTTSTSPGEVKSKYVPRVHYVCTPKKNPIEKRKFVLRKKVYRILGIPICSVTHRIEV